MSSTDAALDLLAGLVLEDGRTWGEAAEPWQWADAGAVLDVSTDAPRFHYLTRPRGASKTADLAGVALAALVCQLASGARSYGVAADRDQGALIIDSINGYLERTPGLRGAVDVTNWTAQARQGGASFEVLAADAASSWGLRPHLVVVDEFAQWASTPGPRQLWRSIFSAMPKVPGSRLVVLTSAGDPAHWSHDVLERARRSPTWRVSELPGPCPWISPADLEEQERELPPWLYQRLHLNRWVAGDERLTSVDDLRACVTLAGPLEPVPGLAYAIGLDVGLKRDRTVLTVAHSEPRGEDAESGAAVRVVLDRQAVWQGSRSEPVSLDEVEAFALEAHQRYNRAPVVVDPWQAAQLMQRLRSRGVRVVEFPFTTQSVGRLAQRLDLLLRDRALALPDDTELLDELANVRLRETSPGVFRLDHDPDRHDDRAVSLALVAQYLADRTTTPTDSAGLAAGFQDLNEFFWRPAW